MTTVNEYLRLAEEALARVPEVGEFSEGDNTDEQMQAAAIFAARTAVAAVHVGSANAYGYMAIAAALRDGAAALRDGKYAPGWPST